MPFDTWLAFTAAVLVIVAVPGPTVILVVAYGLAQGRRVALASALGVALGDLIAISASLAGLGALLLASATAFAVLKWIGAAWLFWLGIRLLRSPPPEIAASGAGAAPRHGPTARRVFLHAAIVTALNPKGILFILAFAPQFIRPSLPLLPQLLMMLATFVLLGGLNALAYALFASRLRQHIRRPATLAWFNRAGGGALIGLGLLAATATRK